MERNEWTTTATATHYMLFSSLHVLWTKYGFRFMCVNVRRETAKELVTISGLRSWLWVVNWWHLLSRLLYGFIKLYDLYEWVLGFDQHSTFFSYSIEISSYFVWWALIWNVIFFVEIHVSLIENSWEIQTNELPRFKQWGVCEFLPVSF